MTVSLPDKNGFTVVGLSLRRPFTNSRPQTPKNRHGTYIPLMSIELMRKRLSADRARFVEPCLPSPADKPPPGSNWIHEIKHDGFRLMARRDPVGIRLITRNGND
jgi:ATP-dependent DNA ligase